MKTCWLIVFFCDTWFDKHHSSCHNILELYNNYKIFLFLSCINLILSGFFCLTVVQSQNGWSVKYTATQICALKGSTVTIQSTYTYPSTSYSKVEKILWFIEESDLGYVDLKTDPGYSGRVHYNCTSNVCSLKISNVSISDSATYKFRFETNITRGKYSGVPGVTLTVTDLQVKVNKNNFNSVQLTCHTSCTLPGPLSYIWYSDGKSIDGKTSSYYEHQNVSTENYSCALKGHENTNSSSVYAPRLPSVSPSGEILEGSSVTFNCSSDANPAAKYTWYKVNGNTQEVSDLVIGSIKSSDSGEYRCTAENDLGNTSKTIWVDVKYPPRHHSVSVSPSGEIVEGSSVTLNCSSDANPAATYTWYRDNQQLSSGLQGIHIFTPITYKNGGNYYCKSENKYGQINSSRLLIDVKYPPKSSSVSVTPPGEIMENTSVTLTCNTDAKPAANYTWYKDNQKLRRPSKSYEFISISPADSGKYFCKSENRHGQINSSFHFVDVQYPPRRPSVSVSSSGEIVEGGSVTLTCSSDANPAATYTWYKENEDSPKASGQTFTIADSRPEHSGNYYCEAQNIRGRHNSTSRLTIVPVFPKELKFAVIGISSFVLLAIILVFVLLLKRKKKASASEEPSEPGESPNIIKQHLGSQSDEQEELHYASVRFLKTDADAIYANIEQVGPRRHKKEEDESVVYAAVKFNSGNSAPSTRTQENEEDKTALYSTVNKIR
ncbi:Fc receptor-like protein 2 isoform X2 [Mugil cephalus]|uniref:Fc receptor-like protein 2 isoform X2 n=1 Tax=Mugil cephalus TaxID=48193 RepID=UPI001FB745AF|nr:Fc receptor-like protein 2 isoform X2 [Mugil cephalus]